MERYAARHLSARARSMAVAASDYSLRIYSISPSRLRDPEGAGLWCHTPSAAEPAPSETSCPLSPNGSPSTAWARHHRRFAVVSSSSPMRRNGGRHAQGRQAPGADERSHRHGRRQGDRREGRLRLPAQHLTQEARRS